MVYSRVKAMAYASIANLGPGFDVFAISIDAFYDVVQVELAEKPKVEVFGIGAEEIPKEMEKNSAGLVAKRILEDFRPGENVSLKIWKGVRPGSGLGSSSASAAACALALNKLLDLRLSMLNLVKYASFGEIATAGFPHADNVSAALLGGFTVVQYEPFSILRFDPPRNLAFAIALPNIQLTTRMAREVIPKRISIRKLVHNVSSASFLLAGMISGEIELIGKSMSDAVVEPARARLIPGYNYVRKYALKAGAYGVAISGAGPAMVAVVDKREVDPKFVAERMKEGFRKAGVQAEAFTAKPAPKARVIKAWRL